VLLHQPEDRRIHRYFIAGRYRGVKTRLARKQLKEDALRAELLRYEERRQQDETRLEQMMLYAQTMSCRWRTLLTYFERDESDPDFSCQTCDACSAAQDAANSAA
jgi:ATP-dependent DNA helicase RecQ